MKGLFEGALLALFLGGLKFLNAKLKTQAVVSKVHHFLLLVDI
jgi:hypothetical protein